MSGLHPTLTAALVALCLVACNGGPQGEGILPDAHHAKVIAATAAAEGDILTARKLLKDKRTVDALNLLLNRIKTLQTLLYDEYILKSRAYDRMDLPTARSYGKLIGELEQAENTLVKWLNEPLDVVLNRILIDHPDPRKREEALDAIDSGANEIFIQFKTGYRREIVRSLKVRGRSEPNVAVQAKMRAILSKLDTRSKPSG